LNLHRAHCQVPWRHSIGAAQRKQVSIAFGALLIVRPGQGILTVLWLVGVMSIAMGVLLLVLSFRLRSLKERFGHLRPA
jgi:uncharacterized membrane protein HdeD (DUF308 family)